LTQIATLLRQGLAAMNLALPAPSTDQLAEYLALMVKWNRVYNLTAVHDEARLVSYHILDSLSVLSHLSGASIVDVGSGAGLPGIPIAIARPDIRVALLDANHKKAAFLQEACAQLGLDNARVVLERSEAYRPAQAFDTVISRAFSDLTDFVKLAGHLCAPEGVLLAMKGPYPHEEIAQLPPSWRIAGWHRVVVANVGTPRHLVIMRPQAIQPKDGAPCHVC